MSRVVIAVVYAVDVLPAEAEDPQTHTFERFTGDLPECPNATLLFASGVLAANENDVTNPDFEVDVRSHGRNLEPVPYSE
jgi:hypothetical protein